MTRKGWKGGEQVWKGGVDLEVEEKGVVKGVVGSTSRGGGG